ncbi:MAG: exosortase-associated EpsI family protein [Verrucomicrobiota bacterium]
MKRPRMLLGGLAIGLILLTGGMIQRLRSLQELGAPGVLVTKAETDSGLEVVLPERVLEYASEKQQPLPEELGYLPKDTTYGRRLYQAPDGFQILVSVVMMGTDRTSIHRPEFCLTGQGWKINQPATGVESIKLESASGKVLEYNRMHLDKEFALADGRTTPARGLYLYWFVADGQETPGQMERMLMLAGNMLRTGKLQRWSYVAYFVMCRPEQEAEALERVRKFIAASAPEFQISAGAGKKAADRLHKSGPSTMLTDSKAHTER